MDGVQTQKAKRRLRLQPGHLACALLFDRCVCRSVATLERLLCNRACIECERAKGRGGC